MIYEKKKLIIHKLFWIILFAVDIILTVMMFRLEKYSAFVIFCCVDFFVLLFCFCALFLSCNIYEYAGKEIIVYAGWYHHYLKVDNIKIDEYNTFVSYTAIILLGVIDDGTDFKATISTTNRITLKINNKLYFRCK